MKTLSALFFAFYLCACPALAAEGGEDAFRVLCQSLPEYHAPEAIAYKAGVDVHGKPVVPADLNPLNATVPDVIIVPVTVDLAQHFSSQNVALPDGVKLEPDVGVIEIHQDGRVTYNGQNLSPQVYSVCKKDEK